MAQLDKQSRDQIKNGNFALPEQRRYPIHDLAHAKAALRMVAANGTPEEIKKVKAAVFKAYPQLRENSTMNDSIRKASGRKGNG